MRSEPCGNPECEEYASQCTTLRQVEGGAKRAPCTIGNAAAGASAANQPNILWIVADDLGCDMGVYGTPDVHTPHLNALAAARALFTRA